MPSVKSSSSAVVEDSSTVMTPSLPTLSNASAMSSPMSAVLGGHGRDVGDLVACPRPRGRSPAAGRDTAATAASMPRLRSDRGGAGSDVAQALADHRLGQHGGGGGAVTGDVVGLGRDLLGQLGAEVLVRVLQLDLAGDGHAVVGDGGGAPLLVDDDVAALRAEGHLDGVGQGVDAALERLRRASSSNSRILAMCQRSSRLVGVEISDAPAPRRAGAGAAMVHRVCGRSTSRRSRARRGPRGRGTPRRCT